MAALKQPILSGVDFIRDPQIIAQQISLLYGLRNLSPQMVVAQASQLFAAGFSPIVGDPPNLILPMPFIAPNGKWVLPSGTFSRATFDPTTVTTAQLAQRVAALEQDLAAVKILPT